MNALVIGAAGFVGKHLISHLMENGWRVAATKLPTEALDIPGVPVHDVDICDKESLGALLSSLQPDVLFHLAAQSSVARSWQQPELTVQINILGALHVLEAVRALPGTPRLLMIGSGEEYGAPRPEELPVTEETLLRPGNVYAVTKAAQSMLGTLYAKAYAMQVLCVRAFNHIGPGQATGFVVPDFCRQIVRIERGEQPPTIQVGNLAAQRDFTDVRDIVRAYRLLAEKGRPGEVYNVGRGRAVSIQALLDLLLAQSTADIEVAIDKQKFRQIDVPLVVADTGKLQRDTGWAPGIPLETSLKDTLAEYRREA